MMTEHDVQALFERQRAASRAEPPPGRDERRAALAVLERLVLGHVRELAEAVSADFGGRARMETELLEVVPLVRAIRHARRHLGGWMKPERRRVDLAFRPGRAWVRHEPLGVVGIMAPWNYPVLLALGPLVDALAAGNRALVKPSDLSPYTSALLAELVGGAFPADRVAIVPGDVAVARAFSALPFDHLLFTGSGAVGREVMRAAAANLTPVTLELGGKSPAIVAPDYAPEKAAASIAFGKFLNAGQTCIAPDYALVPAGTEEAFAQAVLERAGRAYPTLAGNEQYSAVLGERGRARLHAALDEARAAGARVLTRDAAGNDPAKIAPTVVLGAPEDGLLLREEIFGPILPVVPYRTLEEAMAFVAARERPLALYLFSHSRATQRAVLDRLPSGGVTLNGTLLHIAQESLPFGGIGPSGMGAYHGRDGFRRLSHARAVYRPGFINGFERLGPPWGGLARLAARVLGGVR